MIDEASIPNGGGQPWCETELRIRSALVTGAGSGIGRATATLLADEGATVIVADIDASAAERVASAIRHAGGKADAVKLNVTDETAWKTVIAMTLARQERLDVLVNNAGIAVTRPLTETTLDEWRRVMAVNLEGVFLGTKYAIDAMSSSGGGSIINIASVAGINAYPGSSVRREQGGGPAFLEDRRHRVRQRPEWNSGQRRRAGWGQDAAVGLR